MTRRSTGNTHTRRSPASGGAGGPEILTAASWAARPDAAETPLGTRLRLGSGRMLVRTHINDVPAWLPDIWGVKSDGTLYTQAWGTFGTGPSAKSLVLQGGSTPPAVANSWVMAPDLCIDTSGGQVSVNGYGLLQGTPPNTSDGYLLYAVPKRTVSALVDYCHIYCSLAVLGTEYLLRLKLDSTGRLRFGEVNDNWSTGVGTYEANVPIFAHLGGASAEQNRIAYGVNSPLGSEAVWNTSLGSQMANANEAYAFGLACVSTGGFTPVAPEHAMTWDIVGLLTRS